MLIIVCFALNSTLSGQTNLISNSDLETFNCLQQSSQLPSCPWIGNCIPGWDISHGTPQFFNSPCIHFGTHSVPDHRLFLVCQEDESEGVFTRVNLNEGCYKLYVKVRINNNNDIPSSDDPGTNLMISLNKNLDLYEPDEFSCQQPIPEAENTLIIVNQTYTNIDPDWQWVIAYFNVEPEETDLNQLMITGLSVNTTQTELSIDCIYLYRECDGEEFLAFTAPPIPNGTYRSCTYAIVQDPTPSGITVPTLTGVVNIIAVDYIRMMVNFRALSGFRAYIEANCDLDLSNLEPPCCDEIGDPDDDDQNDGRSQQDQFLEAITEIQKSKPTLFPNPVLDQFTLDLPSGEHHVKIYNAAGSIIFDATLAQSTTVDVQSWPEGLYLIEVMDWNSMDKSILQLIVQ